MAWISVYQEVDGPKLRKVTKKLECSKAEALGILNFLWFWGMNNADETGMVLEADRFDIENALTGITEINTTKVVDALFDAGWLDDRDEGIFIHDWDTWQEQWYKLQKQRKYDADRKRRVRATDRTQEAPPEPPKEPEPPAEPPKEPEPPKTTKAPKAEKPPKKKYAEFVTMTEAEYDKLVEKYGQAFTTACIETLDNYKGSKKKKYDSDYRAILSWVVDRVNEKRPGLKAVSISEKPVVQDTKNPYEEWSD